MNEFFEDDRDAPAVPARNAIIYCRVASTTTAAKGETLAAQEMRCRLYAERKGYSVAGVFCESAVSGALSERPGIVAMLQFIKKTGANSVVVVNDLGRLARNVTVYEGFLDALSKTGAKLECADTGISPDLASDNQLQSVLAPDRSRGPRR